MNKEKIVITGIGACTSIGKNIEILAKSIYNSQTGFSQITETNVSMLRNETAAYIKDLPDYESRIGNRANIILQSAVDEAIIDSNLINTVDPSNVSISIATSIGGVAGYIDSIINNYNKEKTTPLNPQNKLSNEESAINIPFVLLGYDIAERYNFSGPIVSSITACSAGGNALSIAKDLLITKECDAVIVAGIDPLSELTLYGFNALKAMTKTELKTMDNDRSGLITGEGAGCIILEREESALKRDQKIYCRLSGVGICGEAYHATQPHPDGLGAYQAMSLALNDSELNLSDIDYVNMHGTGTRHNDSMEIKALLKLFGEERLSTLPISSSKSMIGHTLAAAGVIEAIISILTVKTKNIPPNVNFSNYIEGYKYNLIKETTTDNKLKHVMSNSFGFAGNCASIIFSEYQY